MKRPFATLAAFLLMASPCAGQRTAPTPLDRAAWLAGCWLGASGERTVEERWSPPRGGTMVGMGRSTRGGATTSVELAILRPRGDTLRYEAHPVGQLPTVFSGTGTDPRELIFDNPTHDFPQRIIYRRVGADSLHARVEGPMDGSWRGIDYRMARVRCEP
jgi:hypothetical protein